MSDKLPLEIRLTVLPTSEVVNELESCLIEYFVNKEVSCLEDLSGAHLIEIIYCLSTKIVELQTTQRVTTDIISMLSEKIEALEGKQRGRKKA